MRTSLLAALVCAPSIAALACGGTTSESNPSNPTPAGRSIELVATEFKFTPNQVSAHVDEAITFVLKNGGTMGHSLDIELPDGDAELDGIVAPGASGDLTATMPHGPGTFTFYCPISNHRQLGMVGTLTVDAMPPTGHP